MSRTISNREMAWWQFTRVVAEHIRNYTVPQYGDAPADQLEEFTTKDCAVAIKRYANRHDSNARGRDEQLRDCVKMAHYAQVMFEKLRPTDAERLAIMEGKK